MSESTAISWCDSTFNPWMGCTKVSPACDHCYAERLMDTRMHKTRWGAGQPRVRTTAANWRKPLQWNAKAFMQCEDCGWRGEAESAIVGCGACGSIELSDIRRRVFCASLADVFDNEVDPAWRADLFKLIYATQNLDWLLLTKRIGNVPSMLVGPGMPGRWPSHARLGITICNQPEADRDIGKLLALGCPNFLSIEPMLGRVDVCERFGIWWNQTTGAWVHDGRRSGIDWIICGGESGPSARPMHPDWVRSLRDQCAAAGVPLHFKQWGEWAPGLRPASADSHRWPIYPDEPDGGVWSSRIGTQRAGRLLDGIEHNGFPHA